MNKIIAYLSGKKTYIVAGVIVAISVAARYGVAIPVWILGMVAAVVIINIRHAISKAE